MFFEETIDALEDDLEEMALRDSGIHCQSPRSTEENVSSHSETEDIINLVQSTPESSDHEGPSSRDTEPGSCVSCKCGFSLWSSPDLFQFSLETAKEILYLPYYLKINLLHIRSSKDCDFNLPWGFWNSCCYCKFFSNFSLSLTGVMHLMKLLVCSLSPLPGRLTCLCCAQAFQQGRQYSPACSHSAFL